MILDSSRRRNLDSRKHHPRHGSIITGSAYGTLQLINHWPAASLIKSMANPFLALRHTAKDRGCRSVLSIVRFKCSDVFSVLRWSGERWMSARRSECFLVRAIVSELWVLWKRQSTSLPLQNPSLSRSRSNRYRIAPRRMLPSALGINHMAQRAPWHTTCNTRQNCSSATRPSNDAKSWEHPGNPLGGCWITS